MRTQFHHVIDIVPTILEATGVKAPDMVDGIKQKPMEGVSMAYTFDKANANAASTRKTQYFEMIANRGIYHDGWYASTTPPHGPWILNAPLPAPKDYKWELYNITEDYSQANDLAAKMPDKLKEMQALFDQEATKYQVLPLNNDTFARALAPRPSATAGKTVFTLHGREPRHPAWPTHRTSWAGRTRCRPTWTCRRAAATACSPPLGGRWGGWGFYLLNGKPVFNYNMLILAQYQWVGQEALTPGKHSIVFDYTYDGPGIAKGGSGVLKVDGKVVATGKQANSIAFLQVADETFDVGVDTRTGVNDKDYKVPFAVQRHDRQADGHAGPPQLTAADQQRAAQAVANASD